MTGLDARGNDRARRARQAARYRSTLARQSGMRTSSDGESWVFAMRTRPVRVWAEAQKTPGAPRGGLPPGSTRAKARYRCTRAPTQQSAGLIGWVRVLCLRNRKQDRSSREAVRNAPGGPAWGPPGAFGADDRARTGTGGKSHRILSPRRLPIPPHRPAEHSSV